MNKPRSVVAIDLGSNSFQLLRADATDGQFQIRTRVKERVKLAAGLDENSRLTPEAMQRGWDALARFREHLADLPVDSIRAVATHTLRKAINAHDFIEGAKEVLPARLEIISGLEEARLTFSGVCHYQEVLDNTLVIDIGGGSTELALGDQSGPKQLSSLTMGCVLYQDWFFKGDVSVSEAMKRARNEVAHTLAPIRNTFKKPSQVIGSSGTAKAIAHCCEVLSGQPVVSKNSLDTLADRYVAMSDKDFMTEFSIASDRYEVMGSGIAIMQGLFDALKLPDMLYSEGALREGVVLSLLEGYNDIRSTREHTVAQLQSRFQVDTAQSTRVANTLAALLEPLKLSDELNALGRDAASLFEIGQAVHYSGFHNHSAYLLRECDLPGYHRADQSLLAWLVQHCRKKLSSDFRVDQEAHAQLLMVLRLSVAINEPRQTLETEPRLAIRNNAWEIELGPDADSALRRENVSKECSRAKSLGLELRLLD